MEDLDLLTELFSSSSQDINILFFLLQMLLTSILCLCISFMYIKFGHSLSNRRTLSRSFVLIGLTTMIIITIVKSSLALSLGLVGALSIVRFRTAIKEPEELAYFFMVIAIGLGIGAGQVYATAIGVAGLAAIIFLAHRSKKQEYVQNLIIQLSGSDSESASIITEILEQHSQQLELRRMQDGQDHLEIVYSVSFSGMDTLTLAKNQLREKYPEVQFNFLELK